MSASNISKAAQAIGQLVMYSEPVRYTFSRIVRAIESGEAESKAIAAKLLTVDGNALYQLSWSDQSIEKIALGEKAASVLCHFIDADRKPSTLTAFFENMREHFLKQALAKNERSSGTMHRVVSDASRDACAELVGIINSALEMLEDSVQRLWLQAYLEINGLSQVRVDYPSVGCIYQNQVGKFFNKAFAPLSEETAVKVRAELKRAALAAKRKGQSAKR